MKNIREKIILSHFKIDPNFSNGVVNYSKAVMKILPGRSRILSNQRSLPQNTFRNEVLRNVTLNYRPENITIEAAESQASTLLLPKEYPVHIRMHCPFYLYKQVINQVPDEERYSEEVRAIHKAKAVSSPSHGMLRHLSDDLDHEKIHVFKNPIDEDIKYTSQSDKDIDVIFLLRFNQLKGSEYINPILRMLPAEFKVYLIGKEEEPFYLDSRVNCKVTILPHVEGSEKVELLRRAKVSLSLSKFENCSMVILESIAAGTPVVCWNVGGNSEIFKAPIINPIEFEDVFSFSKKVQQLASFKGFPTREQFLEARSIINQDFIDGITHVEKVLIGETNTYFKGIDYSKTHLEAELIPYELRGESWLELENRPIKFVCLCSTASFLAAMDEFFISHNIVVNFIYNGTNKNNFLKTIKNDVKFLQWALKPSETRDLLANFKSEIILMEYQNFTSKTKKDEFTHGLKLPILYCDYSEALNGIFIDRKGWGKYSFFKSRNIIVNHEDTPIDINTTKLAIEQVDRKVLVIVSEKTKSPNWLLQSLKDSLIDKDINYVYLIKDSDLKVADEYFVQTSLDELDTDYTDIFIYDDAYIQKISGFSANYYVPSESLFSNKSGFNLISNGLQSIETDDSGLSKRKVSENLQQIKVLNRDSEVGYFLDECYATMNRGSYRKSGR